MGREQVSSGSGMEREWVLSGSEVVREQVLSGSGIGRKQVLLGSGMGRKHISSESAITTRGGDSGTTDVDGESVMRMYEFGDCEMCSGDLVGDCEKSEGVKAFRVVSEVVGVQERGRDEWLLLLKERRGRGSVRLRGTGSEKPRGLNVWSWRSGGLGGGTQHLFYTVT